MVTRPLTSKGCWFGATESIVLMGEESASGARSSVAKQAR